MHEDTVEGTAVHKLGSCVQGDGSPIFQKYWHLFLKLLSSFLCSCLFGKLRYLAAPLASYLSEIFSIDVSPWRFCNLLSCLLHAG